MTKEEEKDIEDGIRSFNETIRADEDSFETKITYLDAGAITLTLTFLSFQTSIGCAVLMISGLALCGFSLVINIAQYLIAKRWLRNRVDKLIVAKSAGKYVNPDGLTDEIIKRVDAMNWSVLLLAIFGISLLVVFICLNV